MSMAIWLPFNIWIGLTRVLIDDCTIGVTNPLSKGFTPSRLTVSTLILPKTACWPASKRSSKLACAQPVNRRQPNGEL